jgi:hypothetical protein
LSHYTKVETKLFHTLEAGWHVQWEEVAGPGPGSAAGAAGSAGGVRREKVYYDPLAPGVKLYGMALALTHIKVGGCVQAESG